VKTFRGIGDAKNGTADLRAQGNLRGKRSDPWLWANALPGAVADPERGAKTRRTSCRRVLAWSAVRWRNHQTKRAERPHSKSSAREGLDGPAMRPATPLAVENGVGKRAALAAQGRSARNLRERNRGASCDALHLRTSRGPEGVNPRAICSPHTTLSKRRLERAGPYGAETDRIIIPHLCRREEEQWLEHLAEITMEMQRTRNI
jgi:hypothetical protein